MIHFKRLRIALPPERRHEAAALARLAAKRLAQSMPAGAEGRIDHLTAAPVAAPKGVSRERLAGDIATAVNRGLTARRGQGHGGDG
jgi:hypothetical protein